MRYIQDILLPTNLNFITSVEILVLLSLAIINTSESMRKDELELLDNIDKVTINQIYLLETPHTPQQDFLHLFAHRILTSRNLFHRNLDRVRPRLPGSFAKASLQTAIVSCFVENHVDCSGEESPLIELVEQWVNFYPSLRNAKRDRYLLSSIVLQDELETSVFGGLANYLTYLDIISVDLWRIIRGKRSDQEFLAARPLKEELKEIIADKNGDRLDASDLLTFVSGCIPKTLLNVIMTEETLPAPLKKRKNFECLYANHSTEFLLRRSVKVGLLLRQVLMVLLTMELSPVQQKFLMLVVMRYFYIFHFDRRYSSAELLIHAYNRLSDATRKALADEFSLFFKIILKLGKHKFTNFVAENSPFARKIVENVKRGPLIGYSQDSANPYSTAGVAEIIDIERGASVLRTFQVLQDYSIFYFRIQVVSLDMSVKLWYLGEVGSEKEMKKLLLTHEKVEGELKNSINAVRKGLYQFEFDNSNSWINSKRVRYENEVFAPLQIKTTTADDWIEDFYSNIYMNEVFQEVTEVVLIDNTKPVKPPQKPPQRTEESETKATETGLKRQAQEEKWEDTVNGVVNVDRRGEHLRITIRSRSGEYIYETGNLERMVQKIDKLSVSKEKYRWQVEGRTTQNLDQVEDFLRNAQNPRPASQEREEKVEKPKEKISLQEYVSEDEGSAEQVEYEVVEREQLQRSQIINESSSTILKTDPDDPKPSSKQTIEATFEELDETP